MRFDSSRISKADAAAYSSSDDDNNNDDDDYARPSVDPRNDDFLEYNPRKRRKTGRNAKESAALGIFGSDSEDDGPGRRWKSKRDLRYKGVAFVSAGNEKLDEDVEDDEEEIERPGLGAKLDALETSTNMDGEEEEDDDDEDDDGDDEMTSVGLGFQNSAPGLGWAPPTQAQHSAAVDTPSRSTTINTKMRYDGSSALGRGFVPSSASEPVLKADVRDESPPPQKSKPSAFDKGGGKNSTTSTGSFAERMMAKMGYVKGGGLGAEGKGRSMIIEPTLRPQGAGLGAVSEKSKQEKLEEKRQRRLRGEEVIDSDEEKRKGKREKKLKSQDSRPGSGMSTPRKKTKYLTVADIEKAAPGLHIPDAFAPILDMTGRDQKLLTSSSGLLTPTSRTEVIESNKLARRAQGDLSAFVEEWKSLEQRSIWLKLETEERQRETSELESEVSELTMFSSILDEVSQAARDGQWDPVIAGLKKAEAAALSQNEDLANIAVAAIHPFLRSAVQGWQPLEDPGLVHFSSDLGDIRGVLGLKKNATNGEAITKWDDSEVKVTHRSQRSTTFESMMYILLFPRLISTIQSWSPHDSGPLLAVFEKWEHLLPKFIQSQLFEAVARRLDDGIKSWKPRKQQHKQHDLPHVWVFPWLQYLSAHHLDPKGTGLVADIRRKFRQLIDSWEFDRGMIPGLKQWKDIFRPSKAVDQWKSLVMGHILPSLARYLRTNFRVDPSDQEPYLEMLNGVLQWTDIVSPSMVAEILVAEVFPMWHDVLYQWLINDPDLEEIATWFTWWETEVFTPEIASQPSMTAEFKKGNVMIEKALDLGPEAQNQLPRPDGLPAYQTKSRSPKERKPGEKKTSTAPKAATTAESTEKAELTFRQEVEEWCQDGDLQFIPIRKANEEGKHYFRITARMDGKGGVLAFFRGGDVLAVESRKTNMELKRGNREDWELLTDLLYQEVESAGRT